MFPRGPPKVYLKLREGLVAEKIFEDLSGASFIGTRGAVMALLTGDASKDSHTFSEIAGLLKRHRGGRVTRITVATAEGVAAADFGPFVSLKSVAHHDRFIVWLKAQNRSAKYVIGKAGKVISKKGTVSAVLDQYA